MPHDDMQIADVMRDAGPAMAGDRLVAHNYVTQF
jgi:hypothetical protein